MSASGKTSCKYNNVCGSRDNCARCTGYSKAGAKRSKA
jgi:hypothetical protein